MRQFYPSLLRAGMGKSGRCAVLLSLTPTVEVTIDRECVRWIRSFSGPELGAGNRAQAEYVPTVVIGGGQASDRRSATTCSAQASGSSSWRRIRGSATPGASVGTRCGCSRRRSTRAPPGWPIRTKVLPDPETRWRGLPRELCPAPAPPVRPACGPTGWRASRRRLRAAHLRRDLFADRVVLATGGYLDPYVPTFADELIPRSASLHLGPVPQSEPVRRRRGAACRSRQLWRGDCAGCCQVGSSGPG